MVVGDADKQHNGADINGKLHGEQIMVTTEGMFCWTFNKVKATHKVMWVSGQQ